MREAARITNAEISVQLTRRELLRVIFVLARTSRAFFLDQRFVTVIAFGHKRQLRPQLEQRALLPLDECRIELGPRVIHDARSGSLTRARS